MLWNSNIRPFDDGMIAELIVLFERPPSSNGSQPPTFAPPDLDKPIKATRDLGETCVSRDIRSYSYCTYLSLYYTIMIFEQLMDSSLMPRSLTSPHVWIG